MAALRLILVIALTALAACGSRSPMTPTPVTVTPPPVSTPDPAPPPAPQPPPPPPPPPPTLAVTRLLCFGDSITAGEIVPLGTTLLVRTLADSYPTRLQEMLTARYTSQQIVVSNAARPGEWAEDGQNRISSAVASASPEVVVLLEGANDLNAFGPKATDSIVQYLDSMVRSSQSRGATVLLASWPPQNAAGRNGHDAALVPQINDGIYRLAGRDHALYVDIYGAFANDLSLIGPDGLHPTAAGYLRMAQAVFAVLQANFERSPQTTALTH